MNIAIFQACSQASDAEKGQIEIRPTTPFVAQYTAKSERTDKNKDEFISIMYRYIPSAGDFNKHNYVI